MCPALLALEYLFVLRFSYMKVFDLVTYSSPVRSELAGDCAFLFVNRTGFAYCDSEHKLLIANTWRCTCHVQWATYERVIGEAMGVSEIVAQIDREIAQLQQARSLLNGVSNGKVRIARTGKRVTKKKRNLTPEGRKRIADAVKRRWAEQKKRAAAGK